MMRCREVAPSGIRPDGIHTGRAVLPMGVSLEVVSKLPETWRDAPFREARMAKRCRKVTECYRLALTWIG